MPTAAANGTIVGDALDASAGRIAQIAARTDMTPGAQVAALIDEANRLSAIQGAKKELGEAVAMPKQA